MTRFHKGCRNEIIAITAAETTCKLRRFSLRILRTGQVYKSRFMMGIIVFLSTTDLLQGPRKLIIEYGNNQATHMYSDSLAYLVMVKFTDSSERTCMPPIFDTLNPGIFKPCPKNFAIQGSLFGRLASRRFMPPIRNKYEIVPRVTEALIGTALRKANNVVMTLAL